MEFRLRPRPPKPKRKWWQTKVDSEVSGAIVELLVSVIGRSIKGHLLRAILMGAAVAAGKLVELEDDEN